MDFKHSFMKKFLGILAAVVILGLLIFIWARYYLVFGDGVKAGTLNYVVRKGYVFKTWEGEVILTGLQAKTGTSMQSNEFLFSVDNDEVAKKLELASGSLVQLHYKEYNGAVAWRGYSKFVVDSIVSIEKK
jgi:hypothetical protein